MSTFGEFKDYAEKFLDEAAAFYAGAQQTLRCDALAQLRQRLSVVLVQQVGERLLVASSGPSNDD